MGEYADFSIWAKPAVPFVCIEPRLGLADLETTRGDINTKEGIIELMPLAGFAASYTLSIA